MRCIEQLRAKAAKIGATVDHGPGSANVILDAPVGYAWSCHGETAISVPATNCSQTWWTEACKDAEEDAAHGCDLVDDAEELARFRHDMDDDSWGAPEGSPARLEWPAGATT